MRIYLDDNIPSYGENPGLALTIMLCVFCCWLCLPPTGAPHCPQMATWGPDRPTFAGRSRGRAPSVLLAACALPLCVAVLGCLAIVDAAAPPAQVAALRDLYVATNGAGWTNSGNWMGAGDPCAGTGGWDNVRCSFSGDVRYVHPCPAA